MTEKPFSKTIPLELAAVLLAISACLPANDVQAKQMRASGPSMVGRPQVSNHSITTNRAPQPTKAKACKHQPGHYYQNC